MLKLLVLPFVLLALLVLPFVLLGVALLLVAKLVFLPFRIAAGVLHLVLGILGLVGGLLLGVALLVGVVLILPLLPIVFLGGLLWLMLRLFRPKAPVLRPLV